jgi:large subunit ribosomal protein L20
MVRVKRGSVARRRRKKILSVASGAIGSNSRLFRIAQQHSMKAIRYSYRGRRERKRLYRSLWLVRLNARVQVYGWNYSSFFSYLRQNNCLLNRKVLAQMVLYDPISFQRLLTLLLCFNLYVFDSS